MQPKLNICFTGMRKDFFEKINVKERKTTVKNMRYQTNNTAFNSINLPKMAVKPARKTPICNLTSACFIG